MPVTLSPGDWPIWRVTTGQASPPAAFLPDRRRWGRHARSGARRRRLFVFFFSLLLFVRRHVAFRLDLNPAQLGSGSLSNLSNRSPPLSADAEHLDANQTHGGR
jgi:hypothetical protein